MTKHQPGICFFVWCSVVAGNTVKLQTVNNDVDDLYLRRWDYVWL